MREAPRPIVLERETRNKHDKPVSNYLVHALAIGDYGSTRAWTTSSGQLNPESQKVFNLGTITQPILQVWGTGKQIFLL